MTDRDEYVYTIKPLEERRALAKKVIEALAAQHRAMSERMLAESNKSLSMARWYDLRAEQVDSADGATLDIVIADWLLALRVNEKRSDEQEAKRAVDDAIFALLTPFKTTVSVKVSGQVESWWGGLPPKDGETP